LRFKTVRSRDVFAVANALEFDKFTKHLIKAPSVLKQTELPKMAIRALGELEDFLKVLHEDKDKKKKMNAINAKAMTAMKQKVRKYNKQYESAIEAWRAVRFIIGGASVTVRIRMHSPIPRLPRQQKVKMKTSRRRNAVDF
jgi:hypothetical protein